MREAKAALAIFVKYPEPGRVKTRLAAAIGAEAAAAAYERMLRHVLDVVARAPASAFAPVLYCDPYRPAEDYERYFAGRAVALARQRGGDLGERMAACLEERLARYERALIIGTDCIELTETHLDAADSALRSGADVVLGPAVDGGYYLVGMSASHRSLFEGIAWSTGTVLQETLARAARAGLRAALLPPLADIDTWEDWQNARRRGEIQ